MYDQSPDDLHYTWSSPAIRAAGQTHQTLQSISRQSPSTYHVPFYPQIYPSQYYHHVDNQSQYMLQPQSAHQEHLYASHENNMSASPHQSEPSHFYDYPPFHYPSSPPNSYHFDPFYPPTTQQFTYNHGNHREFHNGVVTNVNGIKPPASVKPGVLRGPPRKPRQSGHALWIGNLPPGTDIMKLKEYFSAAATTTIESIFWISKSNSAFVNYRTSEALSNALNRFHDSQFEEKRLVCRVRRSDASPFAVSAAAVIPVGDKSGALSLAIQGSVATAKSERSSSGLPRASEAPLENDAKKRFFIMKSLATEDLESSVQDGHWVTQEHNETTLNKAFGSAEEVYLIFSANKSGEYFGYARMQGLIDGQSPRSPKPVGDVLNTGESDMPEIVITPSTKNAPQGAVFIDAYRGTIFWEADTASQDSSSPKPSSVTNQAKVGGEAADLAKDKEWNLSSPFKVEWISTNRLPFHRTRGLRNPWNANRDVKIARDGTELETNVGIRLLELFHQPMLPVLGDSNSCKSMGFQMQSPV